MSIYKVAGYAGLLLLAIGGILYFTDSPRGILAKLELEKEADAYSYALARNAATKYFGEDGSLAYSFQSTRLNHFRSAEDQTANYTTADDPIILVYQDDAPWKITAKRAHVDYDRVIVLQEDVVLEHTEETQGPTRMLSSTLTYVPKDKIASTDQPVTIVSPLGTIDAVGMEADISSRVVRLKSKIKGHHQPSLLNGE